jgi:hypothetical protein
MFSVNLSDNMTLLRNFLADYDPRTMCVLEIHGEFAVEVICILFTAIDIYLYGERERHSRFPVSFRSVRCPQCNLASLSMSVFLCVCSSCVHT